VSNVTADPRKLDAAVINGAGTSGTHLGILNVGSITTVTYTNATPDSPRIMAEGG
jgi:hypothetical protein